MTSALRVEDLTYRVEAATLLEGISFVANRGEVIGILGPNGSGKSTLLQTVAGLRGNGAEIYVHEVPLQKLSPRERASKIVYVGDDCTSEFSLTAEETVLIGRYALGSAGMDGHIRARVDEVMAETGCLNFRHRYLDQLSGGERQRVALARALLQGANILALDESFSKLDIHHQIRMGALIRRLAGKGFTFLIVSHDLNFTAQFADRLLLLNAGRRLDFGVTGEVLNADNLARLYPDAQFKLETSSGNVRVYFTSVSE